MALSGRLGRVFSFMRRERHQPRMVPSPVIERTRGGTHKRAERWDDSHVVPAMTNLQTGPLQWSRDMAAHCRLLAARSARPAYTQHLLALAEAFDSDVAKLSPKAASNE
jgi:hypothetical protein